MKKATNKARVAGFLDIFGESPENSSGPATVGNGNGMNGNGVTVQSGPPTPGTPAGAPETPTGPVESTSGIPSVTATAEGTPMPLTPLSLTSTPQMEREPIGRVGSLDIVVNRTEGSVKHARGLLR